MELAKGLGTSRVRPDRLARMFGKFLANGFLLESQTTGESENHPINTGIFGGPGWT